MSDVNKRVIEVIPITTEKMIDVDDMFLEIYQTGYRPRIVDKIVKNFDINSFTKPVLSEIDDGLYSIVDGKHRIEALRRMHPDSKIMVMCDVFPSKGTMEDASAFEKYNVQRRRYGVDETFH